MTVDMPSRVSAQLRRIAASIDASRNPDRRLVAAALRRVLGRFASKNTVQVQVDRACFHAGVYEPKMGETSPGSYEGDFDSGWTLTVDERPGGTLAVRLNGHSVKGLDEAVGAYKGKDSRFVAAKAAPGGKSQGEWEAQFYPHASSLSPEDRKGSQAFWTAFQELGWVDWTPASDPAEVESVMRAQWQDGEIVCDIEKEVKKMYDNYRVYKDHCEDDYISGKEVG
jgi:hypothetical protein